MKHAKLPVSPNILMMRFNPLPPYSPSQLHLKPFTSLIKLGVYVVEEGVLDHRDGMKAKPSWATLHSLLHPDRIAHQYNEYTSSSDLLIAETSEERNASIWSTINNPPTHTIAEMKSKSEVEKEKCLLEATKTPYLKPRFWMTLFLIVKVWQTVLYMLDVKIEGGQISTEDIEQFASGGYFFSWKFWRLFFI